jgi:hypothetical protein
LSLGGFVLNQNSPFQPLSYFGGIIMPTNLVAPLPPEDERVARLIVDSAFTVHKTLGAGLLESVYEACLCHELEKRGLAYKRQVVVPLVYDGIKFAEGFRLDVLVSKGISFVS